MIPNTFYFILFGNKEFNMFHYVAIQSAFEINTPDKIVFICDKEPESDWFTLCKPLLEIKKIVPPDKIFNNSLDHFAHKADVVRLQTLILHGGVYLDLDTICLKPLNELRHFECVMGREYFYWGDDDNSPPKRYYKGLCNAVILAEPGSAFLQKWMECYKNFRSKGVDDYWSEHSVEIPALLAEKHRSEITVLNEDAFFNPSWDPESLKDLFINDCEFPAAYVHHLWEKVAWDDYLSKLTVQDILSKNTTYNRSARKYLNNVG